MTSPDDLDDVVDLAPAPPSPSRPATDPAPLGAVLARIQLAAATPAREEELARRLAEAQRRRRAGLRVTAASLGVPEDEDLRAVVLDDDAPVTPSLAALRGALAWRGARARGCVCVVGGERGTGKTAALAHAVVRAEQSALFVSALTVGATPRNGYSENEHVWGRWLSVAVLALDDVGTETADPGAITALLFERYDHGRATLVSTNLARKDFAARYLAGEVGGRLADRLIHAQGRAVTDGNGRRVLGPGGHPWYVAVPGGSLRRVEARVALRTGSDGGATRASDPDTCAGVK